MNNCVLTASLVSDVEFRSTTDQKVLAEAWIEFPALIEGEASSKIRIIAWNALAETLRQDCRNGDRVVVHGILGMRTVERIEGYKEKVAELTLVAIHPLPHQQSREVTQSHTTRQYKTGAEPVDALAETKVEAVVAKRQTKSRAKVKSVKAV